MTRLRQIEPAQPDDRSQQTLAKCLEQKAWGAAAVMDSKFDHLKESRLRNINRR